MSINPTKKIEFDEIVVDDVYSSGTTQIVHLSQIVTTTIFIPSLINILKKNLLANLGNPYFHGENFGFQQETFVYKEIRKASIDVPNGKSKEEISARIPKEAVLYNVLSNRPSITTKEAHAIDNPKLNLNLDYFANRQVVWYNEEHIKKGQLVMDSNNKPQYCRTYFSKKTISDKDNRTTDINDLYLTEYIKKELLDHQNKYYITEEQVKNKYQKKTAIVTFQSFL